MENEMIFIQGMSFKAVSPKAPETVRGEISFNVKNFTKFLEEHADERGWLNTKMMKSKKDGSIYFIKNTWKPGKPNTEKQASEANEDEPPL